MARLTGKQRKNVTYLLSALIVILGAVLLYVQYSNLSDMRSAVKTEEEALTAAYTRQAALLRHAENSTEYEERINLASNLIPAEPGESDLIRYIYHLAERAEVDVSEIRFDSRTRGENYDTMPMVMIVHGSYRSLIIFLKDIYEGERAVRVNNVRIARDANATGGLRITLNAAAFYKAAEE